MVETLIGFVFVGVGGGLLLLERRCLGQIAFVQPLVLCLICGFLADMEPTGLWLGVSLQLLSIDQAHWADFALAGLLAAATMVMASLLGIDLTPGQPECTALIFSVILVSVAARTFDKRLARLDCARLMAAPPWEQKDPLAAFERLIRSRIVRGIALGALESIVGVGLCLGFTKLVAMYFHSHDQWLGSSVAVSVPLLGSAVALGSLAGYRFIAYAGIGIAISMVAVVTL